MPDSADDNVKVQMALLSWPHEFIPLPVSDSCQCSVPLIMEKHRRIMRRGSAQLVLGPLSRYRTDILAGLNVAFGAASLLLLSAVVSLCACNLCGYIFWSRLCPGRAAQEIPMPFFMMTAEQQDARWSFWFDEFQRINPATVALGGVQCIRILR